MDRLTDWASISSTLARLTDEEVSALMAQATPLHAGVGGRSVVLTVDSTPIFVKRVPLTDLERRPEHVRSTANIFDIPLSCHYGFGSPGFSAWRELAVHEMANVWVLTGACADFPLLYHWRVLSSDQRQPLDGDVDFWLDSTAVRARLEAIRNASAHLVLFCEYVPRNLLEWLTEQVRVSPEAAEASIAFVDAHLTTTIDFMNARGLTHFDTHFENIVTDGQRFCFGDFGLALSSDFDLTENEAAFLAGHRGYDRGRAAVGYAHCLIAAFFGPERWKEKLRTFMETGQPSLPVAVTAAIHREAPRALRFLEFSGQLRQAHKQARYRGTL